MSKILSIETSTSVCSVALHQDDSLIGSAVLTMEKSHSKYITVLIDKIIKESGLHYAQLDAVAISKGPGSYTGLRIGVSTAKGICYAIDKPLIAIDTLQAMAYTVSKNSHENQLLCPMIDARRMEVYCAIYTKKLDEVQPVSAQVITSNSFQHISTSEILFFGDGAEKCIEQFKDSSNLKFQPNVLPEAVSIGALAYLAYQKKSFVDVAYFEPFYLKDFQRFGN